MKGIYSLEEYYAKNIQGYYNALTIGEVIIIILEERNLTLLLFYNILQKGMAIAFQRVREKA